MLDFYETILNIKKWNTNDIITIINKTLEEELSSVKDVEGTCKVLTTNIYDSLSKLGIRTIMINISDIYKELKEHLFLIVSYQDMEGKYNYILIDPTYRQFIKRGRKESPLYFSAWPSEILQNINPILLKNLIYYNYSYVDDKNLQDYFKSFTNKNVNITLERLLLQKYKENSRIR